MAPNPNRTQDLVNRADIEMLALDVCDPSSIFVAKEKIQELTGGSLDILVNNAGGTDASTPALDLDLDTAKATFDPNLFSVARMVQAFAPFFIQSAHGRIVNIGSIAGELPLPYLSMHGASKAALKAHGDTLRLELASFGVGVTTVITGSIGSARALAPTRLQLGPNSLYSNFAATHSGSGTFLLHSLPSCFKVVVKDALGSRSTMWLWAGKTTTFVWYMATLIPRRLVNFMVARIFGLDKLAVHYQRSKKSAY